MTATCELTCRTSAHANQDVTFIVHVTGYRPKEKVQFEVDKVTGPDSPGPIGSMSVAADKKGEAFAALVGQFAGPGQHVVVATAVGSAGSRSKPDAAVVTVIP